MWSPVLADALDANEEAALVYGNCYYSTVANEVFEQNDYTRLFRTPTYFAPALLLYYPFGPQPMWRKSVHDEIGLFDETYKAAGDWDFAIRLGQRYRALHVDEYLGLHYVGDDTISSDNTIMRPENEKILAEYMNHPVIANLYRMEGVVCDTSDEIARMLFDIRERANEFVFPNGATGSMRFNFPYPLPNQEEADRTLCFAHLPSQRELSLWEE